MGDMSRMNNADKFVNAFDDLASAATGLKPGDKLEVLSVGLASCSGYEVKAVVTFKLPNGQQETLEVGEVLFDPDYSAFVDDVEWLPAHFGIDEAEYERRMRKGGLLGDEDEDTGEDE